MSIGFIPQLHHLIPPAQSHHDGRWCIAHISLPRRLHLHVRVQLGRREVMLTPVHRYSSSNRLLTQILGHHRGGYVRCCTDDDSIPGNQKFVTTSIERPRNVVHRDADHRGNTIQELCRTRQPHSYTVRLARMTTMDYTLYCMSFTISFSFLFNLPGGSIEVWIEVVWCFGAKRFALWDTFIVSVSLYPISVPLFASVGTDIYARYIQSIHYDLLVT